MELSLLKTLANKHKTSMKKMRGKYKAEITVEDRKYSVLQVVIPRKDKKPLVATWGGIPLRWNIKATLKEQPTCTYWGRSELVQRLLADCCELCGSSEKVEVHHVRAMKHLHEYPGRPKPEWVKRMIALKRKTLLLCRTCHMDVQYGRPLRRQIIKITEVKTRQKERLRC